MTTISSPVHVESSTTGFSLPETDVAGWFEDPEGRHHQRYFDGGSWTDHVTHFGPTPCVACRRHHD